MCKSLFIISDPYFTNMSNDKFLKLQNSYQEINDQFQGSSIKGYIKLIFMTTPCRPNFCYSNKTVFQNLWNKMFSSLIKLFNSLRQIFVKKVGKSRVANKNALFFILGLLIIAIADWLYGTCSNDLIPKRYCNLELQVYFCYNRTVSALNCWWNSSSNNKNWVAATKKLVSERCLWSLWIQ